MSESSYSAIIIGVSAGGVEALNELFPQLPKNFPLPILVVLHLNPTGAFIPNAFYPPPGMTLREAEEKEAILPGVVYFAPPNYHLLVEDDETFSLSVEAPVCYARPSIDVTFMSAAEVYRKRLIGIVLTGANEDGANGLKRIKDLGGLTIAQDPKEAKTPTMPEAAIKIAAPHHVFNLKEIALFLTGLQATAALKLKS
jgi:two-component system chemotaxis response regulator CheB